MARPLRRRNPEKLNKIKSYEDGSSTTHYPNGSVRVRGAMDDVPRKNILFPDRTSHQKFTQKRGAVVERIMDTGRKIQKKRGRR